MAGSVRRDGGDDTVPMVAPEVLSTTTSKEATGVDGVSLVIY